MLNSIVFFKYNNLSLIYAQLACEPPVKILFSHSYLASLS